MSSIDMTSVGDEHMTDKLLSGWLELFRQTTGKFPDAIIITLEQGKKWFLNANEIMSNYKGVPLEIQQKADQTDMIVRTINAVLTGMHTTAVKDTAEVYRLLENMKEKITNKQGEQPNV